ncbi:hypothetical protein DW352_03290 [Pseudolabrys taiwanensis]|uniref:Uncharacterized protein n=1 Tax=Pseudolabrys taiwanensis TaxID=331696 RepID=A0A345ZRS8_9HYPH|nr:hypothetical protein DW352_03290 [Pseudolabrys taiwanensis]
MALMAGSPSFSRYSFCFRLVRVAEAGIVRQPVVQRIAEVLAVRAHLRHGKDLRQRVAGDLLIFAGRYVQAGAARPEAAIASGGMVLGIAHDNLLPCIPFRLQRRRFARINIDLNQTEIFHPSTLRPIARME